MKTISILNLVAAVGILFSAGAQAHGQSLKTKSAAHHVRAYAAEAQRVAPQNQGGFTAFNIHFDRSLAN